MARILLATWPLISHNEWHRLVIYEAVSFGMTYVEYQMETMDCKSKLVGLGIKIAVVPEIMSRNSC